MKITRIVLIIGLIILLPLGMALAKPPANVDLPPEN